MRMNVTLAFVVVAAVAPLRGTAAAADGGAAAVEYRRTADALIVRLTEMPGEMDVSEGSPTLEIYGDGRMVVHRPAYMRNAGDRTLRLGAAELDELLASLADKGIPTFDAEQARAAKRGALQARLARRTGGEAVSLRYVADAPTTVIEIHLDGYRAAGARAASPVDRTISWYGVAADAEQYPAIDAIRDLAAARAELLQLMKRSDATASN